MSASPLRPLRDGDHDNDEARVDLAPLIDVVFLLLIFYVVAATVSQSAAVPIQRPSVSQAEALPVRPLQITLSADGAGWLGNQPWQHHDLASLRHALGQRQTDQVVIHADERLPSGQLLAVIDTCRAAGADAIAVAADRGQP